MAGNCDDAQYEALMALFDGQSDAASKVEALCSTFITTVGQDADLAKGLNTVYSVLCGALVFIMHAGFAMLCAGAIRSKNTMNILLQTVLDAVVSAIAFYTIGFGFAYGNGDNPNGFIGEAEFGLAHKETKFGTTGDGDWSDWFFQWTFATTATTIPAGAVAERFNFNAYLGYSFFISAFVYPVVVHWVWDDWGWLGYWRLSTNGNQLFGSGMIDFAGSGVVHMVGGLSGLMGCVLVGPRMGRFDSNGKPVDMPGHSATLVVLGTVLLWFGWYGFNPGSMLFANSAAYARVIGRAACTTTLSGAAGGLMGLIISFLRHKAWDLLAVCNGVLVGFVSITAGCHVVEPWAAIIAGALGDIIFEATCSLFLKLKIDDPLAAAPMHGIVGAWAVFFVGLLAKKDYVYEVYSATHADPTTGLDDKDAYYPYGLFYPGGGGRLLASQVIGIISISAWVCGLMGAFFAIFKALGMLRISAEEEQAGLDVSKHGGSAYNFDHGLGKPEKAGVMAA